MRACTLPRSAALSLASLASLACLAACAPSHDTAADDATTDSSEVSELPDLADATPHAFVIDPDPPLDWDRSPHTGWTRAHHQAVFARLCHGVFTHASEHGAKVEFGGPSDGDPLSTAGFEGMARTLLGIGYWLENAENPALIAYEGHEMDLVALSRRALLTGTDPADIEYWGPILDHQQGVVEAAWVAEFLLRSEPRVWAHLSGAERDQVMTWLRPADKRYDTNWALFEMTRDLARRRLGYPTTPGELEASLDAVETGYVADGWYADGDATRFNHYNAYVLHPSLLLWARELGDDPARRARIHARARAFLHHFPYWFGSDGAPVLFGRSLAYRSAILAALQAAVVADVSPLSPGLARRLSSGNLRFHVGTPAQDGRMFGSDDLLQLGFVADEPGLVDPYVDTGSLYLMTRGLQVLSLAESHPFWSATEEAIPADTGGWSHCVPAIGVVLNKATEDEGVRMQSVATYKSTPSYAGAYDRLGYGSSFAFDTTVDGPPYAYDRLVTTSTGGALSQLRRAPSRATVLPGGTFTAYSLKPEALAIWHEDDLVRTIALERRSGDLAALELRLTCVSPSFDAPTQVYEGGTVVGGATAPTAMSQDLWTLVEGDDGASLLAGVAGWIEAGPQLGLDAASLDHALAPHASFPSLRGPEIAGERCYLSAALARESSFDAQSVLASLTWVEFDETQAHARVEFDDGDALWMSAADPPAVEVVTLGDTVFAGTLRSAHALVDGALGAAGVRSIDAPTLGVVLDAPGYLDCEAPRAGCRRCALDQPATFALAGSHVVAGLRVDGSWSELPDAYLPAQQQVRIDAALLETFAAEQELTLATFRLCTASP